ncbi:ABC transporter permease [Archangium minus]|uniref:ABC transporter permease n=1 Tax=Archangium minus TaxID=83450 RepID=A0ABY9WVB3_9BACT|nr:ABC transporter permease [Archangium violaceum]WNG47232.1 ABC transporter permease [Archangium minus]
MKTSFPGSLLAPVAALAVLLGLWEGVTRAFAIPVWLLPPPSAVAIVGAHEATALLGAALTTGRSALLGFGLSALVGVLAAILLSSSKLLERAFYPYTLFLQTVPIIAIAPLLVLWFGPGGRAVAASSFIVSLFPVIANTLSGMRSVEPALRDLFRLYGARRLATLWKLELPAALPHLFTGLRVASGLAVIGAIGGEFVAGFSEDAAGLGILVLSAYRQLRTDLLFAAVLAASVVGLALFGAVSLTGSRLLRRWHPSASGS